MLKNLKGLLERKEGEIIGIASTQNPDRDGEVIIQSGWDLANFKQNPVILAHHNYHSFPIGKATDIVVENGKLMFKMVFSKATEEAKQAYELVKEGILNTFSVGFIPREFNPTDQNIIQRAELLEISLVSVPANPQAIVFAKGLKDNKLAEKMIKQWMLDEKMAKEVKEIEEVEIKSVVPFKSFALAEMGTSWDGPKEIALCGDDIQKLKTISTWYDKENSDTKSGYKLPHHMAEGNKTVWRGVVAAMAALMGARGGVQIPEADRKGVYNHLAKHYKEFDQVAPDFKCVEDIYLINKDASGDGDIETTREESVEVEQKELDVRLLQKTTGMLQELLCNAKKGGAKK